MALPLSAVEYEVRGTIEQEIRGSGDNNELDLVVRADFTVYVRDCDWLIRTEEYELDENGQWSEEPVIREIGINNGTELLEVVIPRRGGKPERYNVGTIVAMTVPVGQTDYSVVGHLWLMFASGCHLSGLTSNLLTPVYDATASAPIDPDLRREAAWELLSGSGSLPRAVIYMHSEVVDRTDASYRATSITNIGGMAFPDRFLFEQYISGGRVYKRATVAVTLIQSECSLESLLPSITLPTSVTDRRLNQAEEPVDGFAYQLNPGAPELPALEKAKKAYDLKKDPPKVSPVVIAVLAVSVAVVGILLWKRPLRKLLH